MAKSERIFVTNARKKLEKNTSVKWFSDAEPCNKKRIIKVVVQTDGYHNFRLIKNDENSYENIKYALEEITKEAIQNFKAV